MAISRYLFPLLCGVAFGVKLDTDAKLDPDAKLDMFEFVQARGYAIEKHFATTEDGYILGMFHMPPSGTPNGQVVLLQHALLDCSFAFILNGVGKSLGFILADEGYDVWFGNNRGNTYSANHTTLTPKDAKFWDFTFSEMARYDLPTSIDYALSASGAKDLTYMGHSEGTMQGFGCFSFNQTIASKVNVFVALAPVAYMNHINSTLMDVLADTRLDLLVHMVGNSILRKGALNEVGKYTFCSWFPSICDDFINLIVGSSHHLNNTRIPVYISQTPAGTSTKNLVHFGQGIRSKVFGEYDYGKRGNQKAYGQDTPPQYDLAAIKVPIVLVTGGKDLLADPSDVDALIPSLAPGVVHQRIHTADYAHLDFTWANDAAQLVYPQILAAIRNVTSPNAPSLLV